MAISHVRELIRDTIEADSLSTFREQVAVVDKLFTIMEQTSDPEKVFAMASALANSILTLAGTEVQLLSGVLPLYEADLEEIRERVVPLLQRREDAREAVYELRGPTHDVRPLSMKVDPARRKEIADAKASSKQISMQVLKEMRPMQDDLELVQHDIGAIKRTLRALQHFVEHRFPVPVRSRSPMTRSIPDGTDPVTSFAMKYVENMGSRDSAKEKAILAGQERTRIADLRPKPNWDRRVEHTH